MRINSILFAAALVATVALTACNSAESKAGAAGSVAPANNTATTANPPAVADNVNRINLADARAAFEAGKAVMIDVRGEPSYKAGHIKGAQLFELKDIAAHAGELPKDKTIILYCSCPAEQSSISAAQTLKAKGVENTTALVGGYNGWKAAGYPVVETAN